MGKQICFFASPIDVDKLFDAMFADNIIVINEVGQELSKEELANRVNRDFSGEGFGESHAYITLTDSNLIYQYFNGIRKINQLKSEVIQFHACTQSPNQIIDTSPVNNNFKKGEFIVIGDSDEYHRQMAELMKNPVYIDNPNYVEHGYEQGRFWYSSYFYDDKGRKVIKSREIENLFSNLGKRIKRNFKLTKDKFAYIGPDAYAKFLEGEFLPCQDEL